MTSEEFAGLLRTLAEALPAREYDVSLYERALRYPWERPSGSFLLSGREVETLGAMSDPRRQEIFAQFAVSEDGEGCRFPLLAYGSNGAPETLAAKFAHLSEGDRDVLVLAGELHDFDVGASAHPTAYGVMPATLFPSPGSAMRCAVLWVSAAQLVQLAWSEISYSLGRLDGVRLIPDDPGAAFDCVFTFISRFGTFCPDGEPVALAAIPAAVRIARSMSQEEMLDAAARIALGPAASSEALVRQVFEDLPAFIANGSTAVRHASAPFGSDHWTPFPGAS